MKKILYVMLALAVLTGLTVPLSVPAGAAATVAEYPLYAGKTIPVGEVQVTNDTENITVTFVVDSP